MSSAAADCGRIRRREDDDSQAEETHQQHSVAHSPDGLTGASQTNPAAAAAAAGGGVEGAQTQPQPQFAGVQPLLGQMRKRPRLSYPLDALAIVELQLVMQFLDADGKLKAARCSRRLMQAASQPFAWKGAPPFLIEALTAADVERLRSSLLRFAPIYLCCSYMASLNFVTIVPRLWGLELRKSPNAFAASLTQMLQHPCASQLSCLRLDSATSLALLSIDTLQLITRLPQLRTLDVGLPHEHMHGASVALLQPLADVSALTDLALKWPVGKSVSPALLDAIGHIAGLRRLSLHGLDEWSGAAFRSFFCSPNMRQLQHLELGFLFATTFYNNQPPGAGDYRAAFGAMQQLQSLTLQRVFGINALLPHLRHAPALRQLSIRCQPNAFNHDAFNPLLPDGPALAALLAAAPHLEVRLQPPASFERWTFARSRVSADTRARFEEQWNKLHRMAAELDRVAVVYEESQ